MFWPKGLRRERIRRRVFPSRWEEFLRRNFHLYSRLPVADRRELKGHILVLLAEKRFLGAGGLEVTDEMKVTVAAYASLLLLHRRTDYYPGMRTVILYPHGYLAPYRLRDESGVVIEGYEARLGESWERGPVVLSWEAVLADSRGERGCRHVVIHEFAHQLDYEDGFAEGAPALPERRMYDIWAEVFGREYGKLRRIVSMGRKPLLDPYGLSSPAEFFAVATEAFFMCPLRFRSRHPELYRVLSDYYRQDPASYYTGRAVDG